MPMHTNDVDFHTFEGTTRSHTEGVYCEGPNHWYVPLLSPPLGLFSISLNMLIQNNRAPAEPGMGDKGAHVP